MARFGTALALAVPVVLAVGTAPAHAASDDWATLQAVLGGIQGHASAPIGNVTTNKLTPGIGGWPETRADIGRRRGLARAAPG